MSVRVQLIGWVSLVISEDSDLLVYGCPKVPTHLDPRTPTHKVCVFLPLLVWLLDEHVNAFRCCTSTMRAAAAV